MDNGYTFGYGYSENECDRCNGDDFGYNYDYNYNTDYENNDRDNFGGSDCGCHKEHDHNGCGCRKEYDHDGCGCHKDPCAKVYTEKHDCGCKKHRPDCNEKGREFDCMCKCKIYIPPFPFRCK